jgi:acetyltransferase-like isoleucine patch superfamily enzyme
MVTQNRCFTSIKDLIRGIYKVNQICFIGKNVSLGKNVRVRPLVLIEEDVTIGNNAFIGYGCIIRSGTRIGNDFQLGHLGVLEGGIIGNGVRLHAQAHIGKLTVIHNKVFAGPFMLTLNHKRPDIYRDFDSPLSGVTIGYGCRIGGNVTFLPGTFVGKESFIGAGSLVTENIPDYSFAYGNPARLHGIVPENERIKR